MLFYAALFITSLLVTLIILVLFNLLVRIHHKIIKSRAHIDPTAHLGSRTHGKNETIYSRPWGNPGSHARPKRLARTHPAKPEGLTPWGWPASDQEQHDREGSGAENLKTHLARNALGKRQSVEDWKRNIGRPIRDDRPSLAGRAYKPSFINFPDIEDDDV